MTKHEADVISGLNMTDQISNEAYKQIMIAAQDENEVSDVLDKIRAEILEEKECAYADFDKYKVDYLGVDSRYVEDELPYDDFRYGMERCIEILDKYRKERMNDSKTVNYTIT